jgi:hypothetical protein
MRSGYLGRAHGREARHAIRDGREGHQFSRVARRSIGATEFAEHGHEGTLRAANGR